MLAAHTLPILGKKGAGMGGMTGGEVTTARVVDEAAEMAVRVHMVRVGVLFWL